MDFSENRPIYMQIVDFVCEQVMTGKWKEKERMLSIRELGASLEVNPNTVLRSYDFLQNACIIENKRGIGYFLNDGATEKVRTFRKDRFFCEELPVVFRNMQLLDIGIEEIEEAFKEFSLNKKI